MASTYEPCGHEREDSAYAIEQKCPTCQRRVLFIRNITDEPELVLPGPELRRIERRGKKR